MGKIIELKIEINSLMGRSDNWNHPAVQVMVGLELGPLKGALLLVFFFPGAPPCFFNRASAAAARSARILALSSSVKFLSITGSGRLLSR